MRQCTARGQETEGRLERPNRGRALEGRSARVGASRLSRQRLRC